MKILVIGATGLLGQEIVIQALETGHDVRCMVRNINKSSNLRRFGAKLVYGDLNLVATIPPALKGTDILVDASTIRLNATYHSEKIDWYGKLILLKSAKITKIKRFVFFSVANAHYYPNIKLINLKFQFEKILAKSKIPYTIFRINSFLQTLIAEYSRRILDENAIWVIKKEETSQYSYVDVCAVAKLCLQSLSISQTLNKSFTITDKTIQLKLEIENLCKTVIGPLAEVLQIPTFLVKIANQLSSSLESIWNIQDQFSYFESISSDNKTIPYNFYTNKIFRTKTEMAYSYADYLRDYLDLILLDLQKLHKSSL